ncbi:MAG TPA: type II toxin-antitoxin system ParD family antitoxin [Candidatus Tectomicrobia bacterium]|jgi:putative addiction module CopG family antidote
MPEPLSLEHFVAQQLASGRYQSYDEMVQEGLRLLQEREQELDRIAEKLRPASERFKRGEPGIPFDAEDIIRRGMERHTAHDRTP